MKNALAFIILFICAPMLRVGAQINLVKNPSFEKYSNCPNSWDLAQYASSWSSIDTVDGLAGNSLCAPDYCNICGTGVTSIPMGGVTSLNYCYNHYPRTGNGMMQEVFYCNEINPDGSTEEDYLQGRLYNTLVAGHSYCVTFYVVNEHHSGYAVDHFGAYLDDGTIDTTGINCGRYQTAYTPQIVDTTIVYDTINWTKVQGSFIANGTERLITIGQFFDTAHINHVHVNYTNLSFVGEYLVDDISVIASDAVADAGPDGITSPTGDSVWVGDTTGYLPCYWYANGVLIDSNTSGFKVHPDTTTIYVMQLDVCGNITTDTAVVWVYPLFNVLKSKCTNVLIWPIPAKNEITVEGAKGCTLTLYDLLGRAVRTVENAVVKQTIDIHGIEAGVYSLEILDPNTGERVCKKVVKE